MFNPIGLIKFANNKNGVACVEVFNNSNNISFVKMEWYKVSTQWGWFGSACNSESTLIEYKSTTIGPD